MFLAHRILRSVSSDMTFAAMEAETRRWIVECCTCGNKRNAWDLGFIKYKAYGTSFTLGIRPVCNARRRLKVWKSAP